MEGYVYILMNPAFQNLIKIGRTTKSPHERADELSSTGTPEKFIVVHSVFVSDCIFLEQKLHDIFSKNRYNKNREFFELQPAEAIKALELHAEDLILPQVISSTESFVQIILYSAVIKTSEAKSSYKAPSGMRISSLLHDSSSCVDGLPKPVMFQSSADRYKKCSAYKYLNSDKFKSDLIEYYSIIGHKIKKSDITLLNFQHYTVSQRFFDASSELIKDRITNFFINLDPDEHDKMFDAIVLEDGQSITTGGYQPLLFNRGYDIAYSYYVKIYHQIDQIFSDEHKRFESKKAELLSRTEVLELSNKLKKFIGKI